MEIRTTLSRLDNIEGVFGFGSFFRSNFYQDIDILVIVQGIGDTVQLLRDTEGSLREIEQRFGTTIDLIFITAEEARSRPLREWHQLVRIL